MSDPLQDAGLDSSSSRIDGAPDAASCLTLPERLDTSAAFALKDLIEQAREKSGTDAPLLTHRGCPMSGGCVSSFFWQVDAPLSHRQNR
ncbi:hypothetical protein [Komagataeibacter kakiaceti]|uniref:hypothetical protein n=1 Tax=Komagataeibacter kakiaceti TaxID=943261 RepID=UPI000B1EA63A|nr:hypothetical protein [Komagataeibacter kakiaceti]